jgi:hypothetical protein
MIAFDYVRNLEAHKLVKEGNFVTEELDEFVRISNALAGGHMRRDLDTLIEWLQSLVAAASPNFSNTHLNRVLSILTPVGVSLLEIGNTENSLKCSVDPAGSILVAKTEDGCHSLSLKG